MSRRLFAVAAALTLLTVSTGSAEPREEKLPHIEELQLRALFARAPGVTVVENENGVTVTGIQSEVIVARVGEDGKLIKACVNSEEAARLFFAAPVEQLETKHAHEK